jgi:formate-dependent nitrite reductase membrane component NrfD
MFQERQTTFGWLVSADLFLSATGGGVFLISFILDLLNKYEPVARIGGILGPILVLIGASFLVAEIGSKAKLYKLFFNFNLSSWMSRGTWILTIFIIFGLAYSLTAFTAFGWLPWSKATALGLGIGMVAALFAGLATSYTGFLFGVVKGIPFWNMPILPLLFFLSGLCTGIAIILAIASFYNTIGVTGFHQLGAAGTVLILLQLLALGGYLEIARHSGVTSAESVHLLKTPLFIGGVVMVGLLVPFCLLAYSLAVRNMLILSILGGVSSVLLLIGGLFQRYCIVRAGVSRPLCCT